MRTITFNQRQCFRKTYLFNWMRRHEITNEQWTAIAPLLPGKTTDFGVTAKDNRLFFNAVVGTMRTDCP